MHNFLDKRQMVVGNNGVLIPNNKSILVEIVYGRSIHYSTCPHKDQSKWMHIYRDKGKLVLGYNGQFLQIYATE